MDIEKDVMHAQHIRALDFRKRMTHYMDGKRTIVITVKEKPLMVVIPWSKWLEYQAEII